MPRPGRRWIHVVFSTHCAWLPGDERGWRSRHHKRHSSGDYKDPPPEEEHEGLRDWARRRSGRPVVLPAHVRPIIGRRIVERLAEADCACLVVSVSGLHVHALAELPLDPAEQRALIGRCKACASTAVRKDLPGKVWAGGGKFKPIADEPHHRATFGYIRGHAEEGAWVWTFRDG